MSVVDSIAPNIEIRLKQCTEPWMCNEILEDIRERKKSLNNFKKQRTVANFKAFCLLRNKLQRLIKSAKRTYFNDKLSSAKNISKTTKGSSNIGLKIENEISFDKKTVANTFNNFFTTIAENLNCLIFQVVLEALLLTITTRIKVLNLMRLFFNL